MEIATFIVNAKHCSKLDSSNTVVHLEGYSELNRLPINHIKTRQTIHSGEFAEKRHPRRGVYDLFGGEDGPVWIPGQSERT